MATYKEIFGKQIKVLASDPTDTGAEGQIWYNTTLTNFRTVLTSSAWSAGGPLATAREGLAGFGLQTAAIAAGGETTVAVGNTEEYNGSGWETKTAMNTANRALAAAGVVTAGVVFGGFATATNAEEFRNPSSWPAPVPRKMPSFSFQLIALAAPLLRRELSKGASSINSSEADANT